MDTIDPMVVPDPATGAPSPEAPTPPHRPFNRLWWALPALLFVLAVGALLNVTLPYYALAPGDARTVDDLIEAPEGRAYPPRGRVFLATVSLQRVKALGALRGWIDKNIDVVHEEQILGDTPRRQYRRQNLQLMDDSKETALVVGLRYLGYTVAEHGKGALVVSVADDLPAAGRIEPGDTILSVDGTPTQLVQQAVDAIRAHKPGDAVRLEVADPEGRTRVEQIVLAEREGGPILGVTMRTKDRTFDLPFDVAIESAGIGGPSAGLAFALGVIDKLSAGELTGGQRVAVTGTIEIDGRVGDVGGVIQKTAAVRAERVRYFLVPPGEYEIARRHAGRGVTVLQAGTLDEAIAALGSIGGDVEGLRETAKGPTR
ncbi:MAG TPA: PDZ domain-containing protein [Acidimicrobiales bacterium]|nr:PDZ domain-containing protein [Acidimicrobiales bacterium]